MRSIVKTYSEFITIGKPTLERSTNMLKFTKSVHTEGYDNINLSHNNRTKTTNMEHVDPDGRILILADQGLRESYEEVFGNAQQEYNERQKRKDRKIDSYYDKILREYRSGQKGKQNNTKQPAYETIIQIGNRDSAPTDDVSEKLLTDYYEWFSKLPNIKTYGAYIHFDEQGAPHMHLDYFYYSDGYKNGMSRQNGMERALNAMGFNTNGMRDTAIKQFTEHCRKKLVEICKTHGIELQDDKECHREHLRTEDYKLKQAVEHEINNLNTLQEESNKLNTKIEQMNKTIKGGKAVISNDELEQLRSESIELKKLKREHSKLIADANKLAEEYERQRAVADNALQRENQLIVELERYKPKDKNRQISHSFDISR